MKQRRHAGLLAGIIVVVLLIAALVVPSIRENAVVRSHFNLLFESVKNRDIDLLARFYEPAQLHPAYLVKMEKYRLLGWEITRVGGQPWPMTDQSSFNTLSAKLYYDMPDSMMKPKGKYEHITHPTYGSCGVVPVTLQFFTDPDKGLMLPVPDYKTGKNWFMPFEPLLTK